MLVQLDVFDGPSLKGDGTKPMVINSDHIVSISAAKNADDTRVTIHTVDGRHFVVKYPSIEAKAALREFITQLPADIGDVKEVSTYSG